MLSKLSPRQISLLLFIACAGLIAFGLYLQHIEHIEPCPLCILQRYAIVLVGLLALLAAIFNPRGLLLKLWSGLIGLTAIAGGSVSVRQIWLQHNPPEVSTCGPDLSYMVSKFPLSDVLPKLFQGEGDCAKVDWTLPLLGLSIAECALLAFIAFLGVSIWQILRRRVAA